ncbi:LysR substrate-binding domain-containing protein [Actinokineospora auranticolor]|nr:LysR substrate-binding domain-containing protein [Actinokineospora auranticolor]
MELRQLEYFLAITEEGGFTRAAARAHVAQPGVSVQIRRLERELGQELFDRTGRTIRLTQAGEALLPYARAALRAIDDGRLAVDELAGLLRGRVTVGMLTATPADNLIDLLADFHTAHPRVEVSLREDTSDNLVEGLITGTIDLAWVSTAGRTPDGLTGVVVTDEPLVAVVIPDDPLATRASLPLAALADRVLGSLPPGTGLRAALEQSCATAGFTPRIGFEASAPEVLVKLAARGMGVAVVPAPVAALHPTTTRHIPLTDPEPRGRIELAWRAEGPLSPPAQALITAARRAPTPGHTTHPQASAIAGAHE